MPLSIQHRRLAAWTRLAPGFGNAAAQHDCPNHGCAWRRAKGLSISCGRWRRTTAESEVTGPHAGGWVSWSAPGRRTANKEPQSIRALRRSIRRVPQNWLFTECSPPRPYQTYMDESRGGKSKMRFRQGNKQDVAVRTRDWRIKDGFPLRRGIELIWTVTTLGSACPMHLWSPPGATPRTDGLSSRPVLGPFRYSHRLPNWPRSRQPRPGSGLIRVSRQRDGVPGIHNAHQPNNLVGRRIVEQVTFWWRVSRCRSVVGLQFRKIHAILRSLNSAWAPLHPPKLLRIYRRRWGKKRIRYYPVERTQDQRASTGKSWNQRTTRTDGGYGTDRRYPVGDQIVKKAGKYPAAIGLKLVIRERNPAPVRLILEAMPDHPLSNTVNLSDRNVFGCG